MAELIGETWNHSEELMPVNTVQKVQNIIDEIPNEILDVIFRHLPPSSLHQTRLVCNKWDDISLKIISSQTTGKLHLVFKEDNGINVEGLKQISKLQSILPSSKCPGLFFTELSLECREGWNDYKKGVLSRETQLLNLIQNFGTTLKCLNLHGITLHLSILRPLIEIWCPNLQELKLMYITVVEDDSINVQEFATLPTCLNLKLQKFAFNVDGCKEEAIVNKNLILSIIESSPKLSSLDGEIDPQEPDFWNKIQNIPHIKENLGQLKTKLHYEIDPSLISLFSSEKLGSLTLRIPYPLFPKEELAMVLETVGESLEELSLVVSMEYDSVDDDDAWKMELPIMKKLKVLTHSTEKCFRPCFNPVDFLEKLPNLETLRFENDDSPVGFESEVDDDPVDSWLLNCSSLTKPHTALTTLSMKGPPMDPATILTLNRMFPNIRDLSIVLDAAGTENDVRQRESWLARACQGFSEMTNLKTLDIHMIGWFDEDDRRNAGLNFQAGFSPLVASQSLEKLKILSPKGCCAHPFYFPPGLETLFANIPKLKVFTVEGLKMKKLSEKRNLLETLDQKGISVNMLYKTCRHDISPDDDLRI